MEGAKHREISVEVEGKASIGRMKKGNQGARKCGFKSDFLEEKVCA